MKYLDIVIDVSRSSHETLTNPVQTMTRRGASGENTGSPAFPNQTSAGRGIKEMMKDPSKRRGNSLWFNRDSDRETDRIFPVKR